MSWFLLLPVLAGFLYALSSLFLKRSFQEGVGLVRTLFISNLMMGLVIVFLFFFEGEPVQWDQWHKPVIASFFFFLGQAFTFLAIRAGDVSVMTPVMGSKVIFVALLALLFFDRAFSSWDWIAVFLSGLAVVLLGLPNKESTPESTRKILLSIFFAVLSCVFFAGSDNFVSVWGADFGRPAFIAVQFLMVALLSFLLVPYFSAPLKTISPSAWPWLGIGAFLLALQALIFGIGLIFTDATQMNIIYTSRGLWGVLLVIWVGSWFGNYEKEQGSSIMAIRIISAVLIMVAISIILIG